MKRKKTITLYHLSYDSVSQFELRVPENRLEGEDSTTKRICLTPSIENCINAKPGRGRAVQIALERNIPLVLYVYKTEIPRDAPYLICPVAIYKEHHVEDAIHNQEYWVTEIPEFEEQMLVVDSADIKEILNSPYPTIKAITTYVIDKLPEFCAQTSTKAINKQLSKQFLTDMILMELPDLEKKAGTDASRDNTPS